MILKIIGIVSACVWLNGANGASYSKVYVQNGGAEVVPVEYVNYGPPVFEPQLARLSASPVVSVPSVSSVIPPCVSPCVVTGQNIAPAPVPTAKFIAYNTPNVPVVVAPSKDNGYEYSYVVYDEGTGDKKAQREVSDGSVVRGEYSFIQPDGYVREVQYRADDLTGFNVIVKKILPESVGVVEKTEKNDPPPCKDVKSEALKEEPTLELAEEVQSTVADQPKPTEPVTEAEVVSSAPEEETPAEVSETAPATEPESVSEAVVAPEPTQTAEPEPTPEIVQDAPEEQEQPAPEVAQEETHEPIVVAEEPAPEVVAPVLPILPVAVPELPSHLVVSYEDIIRCIQSKAQTPQGLNISPLTYIILPAANKIC